MLLRIIRFLSGYVLFTVSGKFPERFINICLSRGIRIWNVSNINQRFTACMYRSDYRRIRPVSRGAGVKLRIKSKLGLPSYIARYKDRVGLVIGGCAFLLSVFVMSQFIWSIDITGLDKLSESELSSVLAENGMYVGAFKPFLNYKEIAIATMLDKKEIGWMAVNVTGSYASVELKEEATAPEVEDISYPCNIKAERDGVILSIEAGEGEKAITDGSGVVKGQVLVSGVVTNEQGDIRLVHADAAVMAETKRTAEFTVPKTVAALKTNGDTANRSSLNILGLKLPLSLGSVSSPYSVSKTTFENPEPLDITLPVGSVNEKVYSLSELNTELSQDSAKDLLIKQSDLYEIFSLPDCNVLSREYEINENADSYTLSVVYTCKEDIAYKEAISYEVVEE